jgi:hypothetical protein
VIVGVAMEEMSHLCLVANLMNALGAQGRLGRPVFPIESGPYHSGFVMRLAPSRARRSSTSSSSSGRSARNWTRVNAVLGEQLRPRQKARTACTSKMDA